MSITQRQFNPFPGLRPFNIEEDYLFFGREEQVTELLKLLRQHRFIAVVGTSGSGKSSLVRAGLLPALHGGTMTKAGSRWEVLLMRPGGDPITNLARSLIDADLYDADDEESLPRLKATLHRSRLGLVESVRQSDIAEGANLLVVVDQFEELFRFRQASTGHQEAAGAFVKLLLAASQQAEQPIYITITMRSDYLGECAEIPGLAEAVNDGEYLIPRLNRQQRRAAIEMPVSVGGGKIASRLLQKLLNDVGDDADQLPVLQHALMRIWDAWALEHQDDGPLDLKHYEIVGGLHEALSLHADEVFSGLPSDRLRLVAEKTFKALTERGPDNRGIRRPTRLDRLCAIVDATQEEVEAVVGAFRRAGRTFLMPMEPVELSPETVIDISHESLMRVWQRLSRWVEEESQSARIYRRLADTALLHAEGKAGVYHDPDLNIALTWRETSQPTEAWAERYHAGFDQAMAFLDKSSQAKLTAERQREEARQRELARAKELAETQRLRAEEQQRSAARLKGMLVGMAVVALFALGAFFVAMAARREAQRNAALAQQNEKIAQENESEAVMQAERARASELLARENEAKAKQQEALAADRAETIRKSLYVSEINGAANAWEEPFGIELVQRTLNNTRPTPGQPDLRGWEWYHLLSLCHREEMVLSSGATILGAAWSPDGSRIAAGTAGSGNRVLVWDARTRKLLADLAGHSGLVWSVRWSPDGQRIASSSGDATIKIWNLNTLEEDATLTGHAGGIRTLAWSRDGKHLATGSADRTARIWDVSTGRTTGILLGHTDRVDAVAWNSDASQLATGSADRSIKIWTSSGSLLTTITGHADEIRTMDWSPDDRLIASASADGTAHLWDVATGQSRLETKGEVPWNSVAWSPSGKQFATSVTGSVDIHDLATGQTLARIRGHWAPIRAIEWNARGDRLLTASFDGDVKIWRVGDDASQQRNGQENLTLAGHGQARDGRLPVAWSLDGTRLATADDNGVIHIWDARTGNQTSSMAGHTSAVLSLAWHPDGLRLASGSEDRSVRIWQVADGVALETFRTNTEQVESVAWSPDGQRLAWGSTDTTVTVWTPDSPDRRMRVFGYGNSVRSVAWSPVEATRLAAVGGTSGATDPIKVWDVDTDSEPKVITVDDPGVFYSIDWSPDGSKLAIGGSNGSIILADAQTGVEIATLSGHAEDVLMVRWSPDGTRLASIGDGVSSIRIWDVATSRELLSLQGHQGSLDSVAWRPDGFQLASGSRDGTAKIWDAVVGYVKEGSPLQLAVLTSQIRGGSDNAQNRRTRGGVFAARGDWDEAAADFERAAELDRDTELDRNTELFQTAWWAAGPYPLDVMKSGPGDTQPDPFRPPPTSPLTASDESPLFWHSVGQQPDGHIDFRQVDVSGDNVVSLAVTRVFAQSATEVVGFSGDDDRLNLWLNGQLVHQSDYDGGAAMPDEDVFMLKLQPGWNTLLFAVENGIQGHAMFFRMSHDPVDLARANVQAGRFREAVELIETARAADPASHMLSLQAADLYLQLAESANEGPDSDERSYRARAREILAAALQDQPDSPSIARRLVRALFDVRWSTEKPVSVTSSGGATMTVLPDSSVLAGGPDPATDIYTVELETELRDITGFRIEALPHDSLPENGPGRGHGNFVMSGFEAFALGEANEERPLPLASVQAEFHQPNEMLSEVLNPASPTGWAIWPRTGVPTVAFFKLEKPIESARRIRIKLHFHGDPNYPNHTLGRFRVAVTNNPAPFIVEGDISSESRVGVILGTAYLSAGDADTAVKVLTEAIANTGGGVAKEHLLLAKAHLQLGQRQEATAALERAAEQMQADGADPPVLRAAADTLNVALEKGLNEPHWLHMRAAVWERLGEQASARRDYQAALELDPENPEVAERLRLLDQNVIAHWDFDFGADDWTPIEGTAVSSAEGYVRVFGPGAVRSIGVSSTIPAGWVALTMRVRSPQANRGRIHMGLGSQPFDIPVSSDQWHEVNLVLNNSGAVNRVRLDVGAGDAPLEIDRITFSRVDVRQESEAILAQYNDRVRRYPEDAHVFMARARLFRQLQRPEEAEADYARAYELAADDPELVRELGEANLSFDSSVIVPAGSTWKYLHPSDGTDPAQQDPDFHQTFANLDYDDSHWSSGNDSGGPRGGFGYGDPVGVAFQRPQQANRHTAYFRHAFETSQPRRDLLIYMQRDDGVIVYLDGREVYRDNVGPEPESYQLSAQRTISGADERRVMVFPLSVQLEAGKHVLAISLHNRDGGSSDLRIAEISLRGAPVSRVTKPTDSDNSK